jgi:hypothetical protein
MAKKWFRVISAEGCAVSVIDLQGRAGKNKERLYGNRYLASFKQLKLIRGPLDLIVRLFSYQ